MRSHATMTGPADGEADASAKRAAIGRRVVLGGGLLLLALLLWSLRDTVPGWMASRMEATVDLATTTERDDARVTRAFEAAMKKAEVDATLEPVANPSKVRHSRLTVRASTSDEAIELASGLSLAMARAFSAEGPATLSVDVRRRTVPVADGTTRAVGVAMRAAAALAAVAGVLLIALGLRRFQAGGVGLLRELWAPIAGVLAFSVAPLVLPGDVFMALFFMAIPTTIAGLILWKTMEVRRAAAWPSTKARIIRSTLATREQRAMADVSEVRNVADVEYEFTLGDRVIRGKRISLGEIPPAALGATLDHYRVGATVPVYYDPKNPENAVLERDPPVALGWLYASAVGVFVVGFAVLALFWNISSVLDGLAVYFPDNAVMPGVAFFTLGGLMMLAMLWASRRQAAQAANWPQTAGHVVKSTVEHYRQRVGGAQSGTLATFYAPVIEYTYRVADRDYHSTQLSFGGKSAGSQDRAEAKAARYPVGCQVMVHYDPENPSNAVLDLKVALGVPMLVIAVVFFALAVFFSGAFR